MPPRHERQHRRRALSMESASSAAAAAASSPLAATAALRQQQRRTGYGNAWARPRRRLRRQERWRRRRRSWWRRRGAVVSPAAVAAVAPSAHASAATAGATGSTGTPISRRTSRSAGTRQERRHRPPQSSPTTRMSSPPPLSTQDRTRLRASGCFPIELVPPPPANAGRGAAKLLDLVRPLSDCIEKRQVVWSEIARTGRVRYAAHRWWLAVDTRRAGARPGRRGGARRCRTELVRALSGGATPVDSYLPEVREFRPLFKRGRTLTLKRLVTSPERVTVCLSDSFSGRSEIPRFASC